MSLWDLGLFAVASFLALRSIISLMTQHKEKYKQELAQKHLQQIVENEAALAKEREAQQQAAENSNDDELSSTAA